MGIQGIENLSPISVKIPIYPVNYDLINKCYLIVHDPNDFERSHMSILVDLGGNSTNTNLIGLLIHVIANMKDGQCPHTTSINQHLWDFDKTEVEIIELGYLSDSIYVNGHHHSIPSYLLTPYVPVNIHSLICNWGTGIPVKQDLLSLIATVLYQHMLTNDQAIWSSTINCQQFARRFVDETLGLKWPNDIQVTGDKLPISVDIDIFFISKKNKKTPQE